MDLRKEILRGHSKAQVNRIVDYVGNNPERFKNLISVYIEGPYRVTQRAAWSISYCVENQPELVYPHLKTLLGQLKKPTVHDALKRNTMRLLQFIRIPKKYEGLVADLCFEYLANKKEAVAVKVFSMTVLNTIAEDIPEIKKELKILIEDNLPYASPAFQSRARKVLKDL